MTPDKIIGDLARSTNPLDQVVGGVLDRVAAGAPLGVGEFRRFLEAQGASPRAVSGYIAALERVNAATRGR